MFSFHSTRVVLGMLCLAVLFARTQAWSSPVAPANAVCALGTPSSEDDNDDKHLPTRPGASTPKRKPVRKGIVGEIPPIKTLPIRPVKLPFQPAAFNDPIRFTMTANKDSLAIGEEVEITIRAELLPITSSMMFFFEEQKSFSLKVLMPEGFVQTGGNYYDYVGANLARSGSQPVEYKLRGVFSRPGNLKITLLRGWTPGSSTGNFTIKQEYRITIGNHQTGQYRVASTPAATTRKIAAQNSTTSELINLSASSNVIVCPNLITLTVSGCAGQINWYKTSNPNTSIKTGGSQHVTDETGDYFVRCLSELNSLESSNTQSITRQMPSATLQLNQSTPYTIGETIRFTVTAQAGNSISWAGPACDAVHTDEEEWLFLTVVPTSGTFSTYPKDVYCDDRGEWEITVTDACGYSTQQSVMVVVNLPPSPTITRNQTNHCAVELIATPEGSTPITSWQWYKDGVLMSGKTQSSLIVTSVGNYKVLANYSGGSPTNCLCGVESANFAVTSLGNRPPVVSQAISNQSAVKDQSFSLNINGTFSDPDGNSLVYFISSGTPLPVGLTFDATSRTISGIPTSTGISTITVYAHDGYCNSPGVSFVITVNQPVDQCAGVTITAPNDLPNPSITAGQSTNLTAAGCTDGATVQLSFNGGGWSGSPLPTGAIATATTYSYKARCEKSVNGTTCYSAEKRGTLTVTGVSCNQTASISPGIPCLSAGSALLTASHTSGVASSSPYNWQFSSNNGTFQNIPGAGQATWSATAAGFYRIVVRYTGCSDVVSSAVEVLASCPGGCTNPVAPAITANPSFVLPVSGGSLILTANCETGTVQWDNASINATRTVTTTGDYSARCVSGACSSGETTVTVTRQGTTPPSCNQTASVSPAGTCYDGTNTVLLTAVHSTGAATNPYNWQHSVDNSSWTTIPGGDKYTWTASATGYYRVIVRFPNCDDVTSSGIHLPACPVGCTTPAVPTITANPANRILPQTGGVSLTANCATGIAQWTDNVNLAASRNVTTATTYYAKCVDGACSSATTSVIVTASCQLAAPTMVNFVTNCGAPTTPTATITASGCPANSSAKIYFRNPGQIADSEGTDTFTTNPLVATQAYSYNVRCVANSGYTCTESDLVAHSLTPTCTPTCTFAAATVTASNYSPSCNVAVNLSAGCSGDCTGVTYAWSGPNLPSSSGPTASVTPPAVNGTNTYTVTLSKSGCTAKTQTVDVVVSGCLPPACPVASANYLAIIDIKQCTGVVGWAMDLNCKEQSIVVSVYVAGVFVENITANKDRSDIRDAHNTGGTNIKYGFEWIPTFNGTKSVSLRYPTPNGSDLPGSPFTLTCGDVCIGVSVSTPTVTSPSVTVGGSTNLVATCATGETAQVYWNSSWQASGISTGALTTARTESYKGRCLKNTCAGAEVPGTITVNAVVVSAPVAPNPSIDNQTGTVNVVFPTLNAAFTGTGITYTPTNLPPGLTINPSTGAITGTPTASGTYAVIITAANSGGSVTVNFTITIQPAIVTPPTNQPPVAATTPNQTGSVGVNLLFTANAFADADGDALTYTLTGLPGTLTFNPLTRQVTGTPTLASTYILTLSALDGKGGSASTQFTLYIGAGTSSNNTLTLLAPTFSCPPGGQGTGQLTYRSSTNPAGQTVEYWGDGLTTTTTSPGPHNIDVYTDNQTRTIQAQIQNQPGTLVSLSWNWVNHCQVPPTPSISPAAPTICPGSSVMLTAQNCPNGTLIWSNEQVGAAITVSPTSTTTLSVACRATNGLTGPATSVVITVATTVAETPTLTASQPGICFGESATLMAQGCGSGLRVVWNSNPAQTGTQWVVNSAGSYWANCQTTTGQMCSGPGSTTLVLKAASFGLSAGSNSSAGQVVVGQTLNLQANIVNPNPAGLVFTYDWRGPLGWTGTGVSPTVNPATAFQSGSYTITATANGCSQTALTQVAISDPTGPVISLSPDLNAGAFCLGTAVQLQVNCATGTPANWTLVSGPGITAAQTITGPTITHVVEQVGSYRYQVRCLVNGWPGAIGTATLEGVANPVISIGSTGPLSCQNTITTLTAQGATTYAWTGGQPGAVLGVTQPGTYSVRGEGPIGCAATQTITVGADLSVPTVTLTGSTITCDQPVATITASVGNIQGNYTYFLNGGSPQTGSGPTLTFANLPGGTHTVSVRNANGCLTARSITIATSTAGVQVFAAAGSELTCTRKSVPIGTLDMGTVPITSYQWSGPNGFVATGPSANVTAPGTYVVTVQGANGCRTTGSAVVLLNNTPPTVAIVPNTATLTCTSPTWAMQPTASANTYLTFSTPNAYAISQPGLYSVTATGNNGCTSTATATVIADKTLPGASISGNLALTCTAGTLLTANTNQGLTYRWLTAPIQTARSIFAPIPGDYTVQVKGANGCVSTATATVTPDPALPVVTLRVSPITCIGATGSLTATVGNLTGSYRYRLNDGAWLTATGPTPVWNNLTAGTYTVAVMTATNCLVSATAIVQTTTALPGLSLTPTSGTLTCTTPTLLLHAATTMAGSTLRWTGGTTNTSLSVGLAGAYSVTATAPNGCTQTAQTTITTNQTPPTPSLVASGSITCANATVSLSAAGGVSYSLQIGQTTTSNTSGSFSVTQARTYTVWASAANGCTASVSVVVGLATTRPVATITPTSGTICTGMSVTLSGPDAMSQYRWTTPGGTATPGGQHLTATLPGTYTLVVTNANGCVSTPDRQTLINNPVELPDAVTVVSTAGPAPGTAVTLLSGGCPGGQIQWSGPNQQTAIGTAFSLTLGAVRSVTLVCQSAGGCFSKPDTYTVPIINPTPPSVARPSAPIICRGRSVTLTASGCRVGEIRWSTEQRGPSIVVTPVVSTTYAARCFISEVPSGWSNSELVTVQNSLTLVLSGPTTYAEGQPLALTATMTPAGSYTYTWAGLPTPLITTTGRLTVAAPAPDSYTLTATASTSAGCAATATRVLSISTAITTLALSQTAACAGSTLTVPFTSTGAFGGGYNFTVQLSDGSGSFESATTLTGTANASPAQVTLPANLAPGSGYRVRVVSTSPAINGTPSPTTLTIGGSSTISLTPSATALSCTTPTLTLSATSGATGTAYLWNNGATTPTLSVSVAGAYALTMTTAGGCTATASTSVTLEQTPSLTVAIPSATTVGQPLSLTALLSPSSGGTASYRWTGPNSFTATETTPVLSFTSATTALNGTYTVLVTLPGGCTLSGTGNLTVGTPPTSTTVSGLSVGAITPTTLCAGAVVTVPFTMNGTVSAGTTFQAQLSDATGAFPTSATTGAGLSLTSTTSPLSLTIPANALPGSGYRVRVVSSNPQTGTALSPSVLTVGGLSSLTVAVPPATTVVGNPVSLTALVTPAPPTAAYAWNGPNSFTALTTSPVLSFSVSTTALSGQYTVVATLPGGCTVSGTGNLTVGTPTASTATECDIRIVAKDGQSKETSKIPRTGPQSLSLSVESLDGVPLTGYSYAWTRTVSTSAGATTTAVGNSPTLSATSIGEYKVVVSTPLGGGPTYRQGGCIAYLTVSKGLCQTVSQTYQCGTRPATPVGTPGSPPLTNLAPGDTIRTGDFDVVVTEVTGGSSGGWQGKGYTAIPYLKNQRIAVELNGAVVNDCYELMSGTVVSAYDPDWGGVRDVNAVEQELLQQFDQLRNVLSSFQGTQAEREQLQVIVSQLISQQQSLSAINPNNPQITSLGLIIDATRCLALTASATGRVAAGVCTAQDALATLETNSEKAVGIPGPMGCLIAAVIDYGLQYTLSWGKLNYVDNQNVSFTDFARINSEVSLLDVGVSCGMAFFGLDSKTANAIVAGITSIADVIQSQVDIFKAAKHREPTVEELVNQVKANFSGALLQVVIQTTSSFIAQAAGEKYGVAVATKISQGVKSFFAKADNFIPDAVRTRLNTTVDAAKQATKKLQARFLGYSIRVIRPKINPNEFRVGLHSVLTVDFSSLSMQSHHIPSAKFMDLLRSRSGFTNLVIDFRRNTCFDCVAIMVEGVTNFGSKVERHNRTKTYGLKPNSQAALNHSDYFNLSPNDAVVADVEDLVNIFKADGLWNSETHNALKELIDQNSIAFPALFNKNYILNKLGW